MNLSERNRKVAFSRWKRLHNKQKENIPLDDNALLLKVAVCGFLAGDGSVQKRKEKQFYHYQIDFFPDDKLMRDTYIQQITALYNKKPSIRGNDKCYNVRFTSKVAYEDLIKFANFGLKKWILPKTLFRLPGAKENWMKAFFSAEAYVNKNSIKLQTVNKKSMKEVSLILKDMGIDNNYYEYNSKKLSESAVAIITITKRESRMHFHNKIGFWHEKKARLLKESLDL